MNVSDKTDVCTLLEWLQGCNFDLKDYRSWSVDEFSLVAMKFMNGWQVRESEENIRRRI